MKLRRAAYFPFGTYGYLFYGDKVVCTVERAFAKGHNAHAVPPIYSCVPEAKYVLEPHNTEKHPHVVALVNPAANVYHEPTNDTPVDAWTAVLIHPGNRPEDVLACIAPGPHFAMFGDVLGVAPSSRETVADIMDYIERTGDYELEIYSDWSSEWPKILTA